jgi:hypothetical protein
MRSTYEDLVASLKVHYDKFDAAETELLEDEDVDGTTFGDAMDALYATLEEQCTACLAEHGWTPDEFEAEFDRRTVRVSSF